MIGLDRYAPLSEQECDLLQAAGIQFVCRYLKNLSVDEVTALSKRGIQIVTLWESTAGRASDGAAAGAADAAVAVRMAQRLGQPKGSVIIFNAGDASKPEDEKYLYPSKAIRDYFNALTPPVLAAGYRVGCYGSGATCADLRDTHHLVEIAMEAGAGGWPGSKDFTTADIQQYPTVQAGQSWSVMAHVSAVHVKQALLMFPFDWDPDTARSDDIGGWMLPVEPAPPPPSVKAAVETAVLLQTQLKLLGLYAGAIDGQVGPATSAAAMRAYRMVQSQTQ